MFLCPNCQRLYHGVPISESEGPCEVCQEITACGDVRRYEHKSDRQVSAEIKQLRESLTAVMRQAETDLASAHAEICKLQGRDPATHFWPEWSPQANSLRWFSELRGRFNLTK